MAVRESKAKDTRRTKFGQALEQGAKEILAHVKSEVGLPVRRVALPDEVDVKKVRTMMRKLPSAKAPLPKLVADQAVAEYFEAHSVAEVWDQLPEAKPLKLSKVLTKTIRKRHLDSRGNSPRG